MMLHHRIVKAKSAMSACYRLLLATAVAAASAGPGKIVEGLYNAQSPVVVLDGRLLASRIAAGPLLGCRSWLQGATGMR